MIEGTIFADIPRITGIDVTMSEPKHYGDGNYIVIFNGTQKKDYEDYLLALTKRGFELFVDNGNGLSDNVLTSTYRKNKQCVTVTHFIKSKKTYVSTCYDMNFSEHLFYHEEYISENREGASTKLHMMELFLYGNSFVIQLKNGHFIISDGGNYPDTPYLLDYLESLTQAGEKPIIEAWFISHAHGDHCGVLKSFVENPQLAQRIYVEGIYYSEVGECGYEVEELARINVAYLRLAATILRTTKKLAPKVYRPLTGQRYYFNDITIDIVHTHEQLLKEEYSSDANDSSTWLMITIEGQKCLLTGDGEKGCMHAIMKNYDSKYFDVDVMTLMHHGFNTRNEFTDFCKVKTLLLTVRDVLPVRKANENDYLKSSVQEYFAWGDGNKVLEFPYKVGTYKTLPCIKWIYDDESCRRIQPNIFRYWPDQSKKEIRTLRIFDNGWKKHAQYLVKKIKERVPLRLTEDGMRIDLVIDETIIDEFQVYFAVPNGWKIVGKDEEMLEQAIQYVIDNAEWSNEGFVIKEKR